MLLRLLGLAVIIIGLWFVKTNLRAYRIRGRALPVGWPETRRARVVSVWRWIILGHVSSGLMVFIGGWAGVFPALIVLGTTHLLYLFVPCQFAFFNAGAWRVLRNIFYLLVSFGLIVAAWRI